MDQIFFENIWPLLQHVIPVSVGAAFEAVPFSAGEIEHVFDVRGWCAHPQSRRCPAEELKIEVSVSTSVRTRPKPILQELVNQGGAFLTESQQESLEGSLLRGLRDAYGRGDVLAGINASAELGVY